jgi:hypothetical protein
MVALDRPECPGIESDGIVTTVLSDPSGPASSTQERGKESGELVLATLRHGECLSADRERPRAIPASISGGLERHRAVSGS